MEPSAPSNTSPRRRLRRPASLIAEVTPSATEHPDTPETPTAFWGTDFSTQKPPIRRFRPGTQKPPIGEQREVGVIDAHVGILSPTALKSTAVVEFGAGNLSVAPTDDAAIERDVRPPTLRDARRASVSQQDTLNAAAAVARGWFQARMSVSQHSTADEGGSRTDSGCSANVGYDETASHSVLVFAHPSATSNTRMTPDVISAPSSIELQGNSRRALDHRPGTAEDSLTLSAAPIFASQGCDSASASDTVQLALSQPQTTNPQEHGLPATECAAQACVCRPALVGLKGGDTVVSELGLTPRIDHMSTSVRVDSSLHAVQKPTSATAPAAICSSARSAQAPPSYLERVDARRMKGLAVIAQDNVRPSIVSASAQRHSPPASCLTKCAKPHPFSTTAPSETLDCSAASATGTVSNWGCLAQRCAPPGSRPLTSANALVRLPLAKQLAPAQKLTPAIRDDAAWGLLPPGLSSELPVATLYPWMDPCKQAQTLQNHRVSVASFAPGKQLQSSVTQSPAGSKHSRSPSSSTAASSSEPVESSSASVPNSESADGGHESQLCGSSTSGASTLAADNSAPPLRRPVIQGATEAEELRKPCLALCELAMMRIV
jgi:hypothetical protein